MAMRLLQQFRAVAMRRHLARSTIDVYVGWVEQFLRHHRRADGTWRTPAELGGPEVADFLTSLAARRRLSAPAQNQALCAIVFLYKQAGASSLSAG